jgi:23S rRNA-/tRNA-specific pseudouridylate synthase
LIEMLLHAQELRFAHPVWSDEVEVQAPLPAEFQRIQQALGL